jgi:hypothetical protein
MFPVIEYNIVPPHTLRMDLFSEHMEFPSIQNDSDTASSTYLDSPQLGLLEPDDSMSPESEYFDEEDMYVTFYDNESVSSGLESDIGTLSHSKETVCDLFTIT